MTDEEGKHVIRPWFCSDQRKGSPLSPPYAYLANNLLPDYFRFLKSHSFHILPQLGGLLIGGWLVWFSLGSLSLEQLGQDWQQLIWGWVLVAMAGSLLSCVFRAARWQMQCQAAGQSISFFQSLGAILVGYLSNQVLPRSGEVIRCTLISQRTNLPFASALGTVITERVIDVLMLGLVILSLLVLEGETVWALIGQASETGSAALPSISWWQLAGGFSLLGMAAGYAVHRWGRTLLHKGKTFLQTVFHGISSIRSLKSPMTFLFYTVMIWVSYWVMTFAIFYAMPSWSQADLPFLYYGWILLGFGTLGMLVPTPGGIGPYHAAIIFGIMSMGIEPGSGEVLAGAQSFAVLSHASKAGLLIIAGLLALGLWWLPISKNKNTSSHSGNLYTSIQSCNNWLRFGQKGEPEESRKSYSTPGSPPLETVLVQKVKNEKKTTLSA